MWQNIFGVFQFGTGCQTMMQTCCRVNHLYNMLNLFATQQSDPIPPRSPTLAAYTLLPSLTIYMETAEDTNFVAASSVQDDTSSPTSCTAEEIVTQSAEIIQGRIDGLQETWDKVIWTEAVVTIWAQVVHGKVLFYHSSIY